MNGLGLTFALIFLQAFAATKASASSSCHAMFEKLKSQSELRVIVVFGYKDARPARFVGDRHERLAFKERLTRPCTEMNRACGFLPSASDADLLTKSMLFGGHPVNVQLTIIGSSVGTDDQENRRDPFQIWKSQTAERAFLNGFREADILIYNGHSRFGGGPDFRPPHLRGDLGVDQAYYQTARTGLAKIIEALEDVRASRAEPFRHLKLLNLYSCSSSQHFETAIGRLTPAGLVFSDQVVYYADALRQTGEDLDRIFSEKCPVRTRFH